MTPSFTHAEIHWQTQASVANVGHGSSYKAHFLSDFLEFTRARKLVVHDHDQVNHMKYLVMVTHGWLYTTMLAFSAYVIEVE